MLNKNLKKFKRGLDKQNNKESDEYDFLPPTFQLPSEYVILYEEFKRTQNDSKILWIMKPVLIGLLRPRSARAGASSSSTRSETSPSGSPSTKRTRPSPTSASATSSTRSSSAAGSSTCASTPSALPTSPSPSTSTAQGSPGSRTSDTTTRTPTTSVSPLPRRQAPDQRGHQHQRAELREVDRRQVVPLGTQEVHAQQDGR